MLYYITVWIKRQHLERPKPPLTPPKTPGIISSDKIIISRVRNNKSHPWRNWVALLLQPAVMRRA